MIKMDDKYIKEYEEMNWYDLADELVEPLSTIKQDLAKTIYIHYAKERDENEQLQNNWNELNKFIEEEKNRLATQVSNTYEDSLGKRRFVNEDIFNELAKVSGKMQELERGKDE